jgi:hypothetical protein
MLSSHENYPLSLELLFYNKIWLNLFLVLGIAIKGIKKRINK